MAHICLSLSLPVTSLQCTDEAILTFPVKSRPLLDNDFNIGLGPTLLHAHFRVNYVGACGPLIKADGSSSFSFVLFLLKTHGSLLLMSSSSVLDCAERKYFRSISSTTATSTNVGTFYPSLSSAEFSTATVWCDKD